MSLCQTEYEFERDFWDYDLKHQIASQYTPESSEKRQLKKTQQIYSLVEGVRESLENSSLFSPREIDEVVTTISKGLKKFLE